MSSSDEFVDESRRNADGYDAKSDYDAVLDSKIESGAEASARPADPFVELTLVELDKLANPRTSWTQGVLVLLFTLGLFLLGERITRSPADLFLIAGVLLIHEVGHFWNRV